jgi:hypothetical protein
MMSSEFYKYVSEYGVHIALWAFLSAVTIYRKEMSVNRLYHDDEEEQEDNTMEEEHDDSNEGTVASSSPSSERSFQEGLRDEEYEIETEQLLDSAGSYCSAVPAMLNMASVASLWMASFPCDDDGPSMRMMESEMTPADLLDHVGFYASFEPAMGTILKLTNRAKTYTKVQTLPLSASVGSDPFQKELPPDVHVHIISFLHPRDVVNLPCVSKKYRNMIDDNMIGARIWKSLFKRDFAWIVEEWNIGREAFRRSDCSQWSYNKDFYFRFGQAYLDYVLAGMNTHDRCLVGIHGNIYDITPFLFSHPGSPDTLMVHSGRDATAFFEDLGHSMGARRLAMSLCVVVDTSTRVDGGFGLYPTLQSVVNDESRIPTRLPDGSDNLLQLGRQHARMNRTSTLLRVRREFLAERERIRASATHRFSTNPAILGHEVNPYYDPFTSQWRLWYTDTELRTVYVPA